MSNEERDPRIVVRDRRAFNREGERRSDAPPSSGPAPPPVVEPGPAKSDEPASADDPRIQKLVTWLFNQAAVMLEQAPSDAKASEAQEVFAGLQALIDMLEGFQEKTRGRLGPGDERLLDRALYQLRMAFMERRDPPAPAS